MARSISISDSWLLRYGESIGKSDGFVMAMLCAMSIRALIMSLGILSVATAGPRMDLLHGASHPWLAWDGHHYAHIVNYGYAMTMDAPNFSDIAFFPLFPLVARILTPMMSAETALVVVANFCSIIGFVFTYKWVHRLAGPRAAFIATLLVATFPGSVHLTAGLTEGPFFMCIAVTLWLLQDERYWAAAVVAGLSTALRPTGVALAAMVPLYFWVKQTSPDFWRRAILFVALGAVSISGALTYQAFLLHRYKTLDAYSQAQAVWEKEEDNQTAAEIASGVKRYTWSWFKEKAFFPQAWNRAIALGLLVVIVVGLFKPMSVPRVLLLLPLIIFLLAYLPNHGLRASAIPRYESGCIPLFMLLALWLRDRQHQSLLLIVLGAQLVVQAYYAVLFSRGVWIG